MQQYLFFTFKKLTKESNILVKNYTCKNMTQENQGWQKNDHKRKLKIDTAKVGKFQYAYEIIE